MRLGIPSWSFILCFLLVFLIAQDSGARKIAITSGRDYQRKEATYDLQQLATDGHIMQVEDADREMNIKYAKKDDGDEENEEEDNDDDDDGHKKIKRNFVKKNEDDDEDHKKNKRKHADKDEHKKIKANDVHAFQPSHMDHNHMDPQLNVFFTPSDLKVGKTLLIYFAQQDPSTSPKFLPREEADQIPFSSKDLPSLLKFFSFSKHSPQAKAMKYTLKQCEIEAKKGENKFCATSLESLLDFAYYVFGSNAQLKVLTTIYLTNTTVLLQNYTVVEVKEISAPKVIGCHPMPYPYAVFYCHSQESDTTLFEVLVEGQNGGRVQAAAICHMDTSKWDPDHVAFHILKVEPGNSSVCHFFPSDNLAWAPLPAAH